MSILTLREALNDIPDAHTMTMQYRYIDGVSHELFKIGEREVLMKSPVTPEALREAYAKIGVA